jgi:hypothetical protein
VPGIDECLLEVMRLPGARGAALVDWTSGLPLGTVGDPPGGGRVVVLAAEHGAFVPSRGAGWDGAEPPVEDVIISNRDSYHVLRFLRATYESNVFLHLWLDRDEGNLALARIRPWTRPRRVCRCATRRPPGTAPGAASHRC